MSSPVAFPQFSKLPMELQLEVWKHALPEPRIIPLDLAIDPAKPDIKFSTIWPPSALLSACKVSRKIALEKLNVGLSVSSHPRDIRVNGKEDTILLAGGLPPSRQRLNSVFDSVSRIAFPCQDVQQRFLLHHLQTVQRWKGPEVPRHLIAIKDFPSDIEFRAFRANPNLRLVFVPLDQQFLGWAQHLKDDILADYATVPAEQRPTVEVANLSYSLPLRTRILYTAINKARSVKYGMLGCLFSVHLKLKRFLTRTKDMPRRIFSAYLSLKHFLTRTRLNVLMLARRVKPSIEMLMLLLHICLVIVVCFFVSMTLMLARLVKHTLIMIRILLQACLLFATAYLAVLNELQIYRRDLRLRSGDIVAIILNPSMELEIKVYSDFNIKVKDAFVGIWGMLRR